MEKIKSGFVSLIGRPNTGKSSLMNYVLKKDISIVTPKAQTTRNRINGIYNDNDCQIVFVDTPGVHNVKNELDRFMNRAALQSTKGSDLILFLAPADEIIGKNDLFILNNIKERNLKTALLITKSDLVSKNDLNAKIVEWSKVYQNFDLILPISSLKGDGVDELINFIKDNLPETNYRFYPDDMKSDQPDRFLVREVVREQILLLAHEEVPHSVAIVVDDFKDGKNLLKASVSIFVERDSQKMIIIGAKGSMIKQIGVNAREKLENIFSTKVFIELFVKVKKNWRQSPSLIKRMGYDKDSY